ncbi:helix-turn-helix domain-containing protein [Mucilaginibacter sp. PAMB04274]|uniref:helix-turn-helix domain-containing protein n=1 Tax=Mucilaginibacter sp. PAMB04274 TaxID=3138568 RepID=UPI0031F6CEE3
MAAIEIITKEDLLAFKAELLSELRLLIRPQQTEERQWLKSKEVRTMLNISSGTLQNLRITGRLNYTKIGGTLFYKHSEIKRLLDAGKENL